MLLSKEFTFAAAHRLLDYQGKCANTHGHTYKLEVTVQGPVRPDGLVMDFSVLSRVVKDSIIEVVDHKNLNEVMDISPSAENISMWIWNRLEPEVARQDPGVRLFRIRLWESPTSSVEYFGGE